jgi:spermidine synthase
MASLALEVVWTRELRLVFGSTTLAASTILVAYMLGLGLGGFLGGRLASRLRNGVQAYGRVEVAIGLLALVVPVLLAQMPAINRAWLYTLPFWPAALCRFGVALLVLLGPTVLMGATLPILVTALVRDRALTGGGTGLFYGVNTLGAVAGVFLATFVLFPGVGLWATTMIAAGLDIAVGLYTLSVLAPRMRTEGEQALSVAPAGADGTSSAAPVLLSYASVGFTALVCEVAWTRALAMVLGSSIYAFASMLAAFLTGIALGSLLARRAIDRLRRPLVAYASGIIALGVLSVGTMLVLPRLPNLFIEVVARLGLEKGAIVFTQFFLASAAMLPPTLVLGALFPLVARVMAERSRTLGAAVGDVYFVNTLGSAVGAFLAGFVLIPLLGLRDTLSLCAAINFASAGFLLASGTNGSLGRRMAAASLPLVAAVALLVLKMPWDVDGFTKGVFRDPEERMDVGVKPIPLEGVPDEKLLLYRDGLNCTVTVRQHQNVKYLSVNGKPDASTQRDMATQVLCGEIPFLFGRAAGAKVLVVGVASGVTIGSAARHPVERIDAVEIEPAILEASHYFDDVNGRPFEDPRVHAILDDGRTYISGTHEKYDVIISEPSNPWFTGVANLFTREYFHAVRERLNPGGRFLQWVQLYALDAEGVQSILAALRSEFPNVYGFAGEVGGDLLFLASPEPLRREDLPRWESLSPAVREDMLRIGNCDTADLWSMVRLLPKDVDVLVRDAPVINSDDNLSIELRAPWLIFDNTEKDNWTAFTPFDRGVVPLLEAVGEPVDSEVIGRLALSYAVKRPDPKLALALGKLAMSRGRTAPAIVANVQLAVMDGSQEKYERNLRHLDEAVTLAPTAFEPRLLRAFVRAELGRFDDALEDADIAVEARPDDPRGRVVRWRILRQLHLDERTEADLGVLLASPYMRTQTHVWQEAGEFYSERGRAPDAIRCLEHYLPGDSRWSEGWQMLAEAYRKVGQIPDAERAERNVKIAERDRVLDLHREARLNARWGDPVAAVDALREALSIDPKYTLARQDLRRFRPLAYAARLKRIQARTQRAAR